MPGPILLADDNPHARRMGSQYLSDLGHAVVTAGDGEAALAALAAAGGGPGERPSLVLVDAALPGLPGAELARRIKSHPEWRDTPVLILIGALAGSVEGDWGGADGVLRKPLSSAGLEEKLRGMAAGGRRTPAEMLEQAVRAAAAL